MKVFITGASGYIGGSVAASLIDAGHIVTGLARSEQRARQIREKGIRPIVGSLTDANVIASAATEADATINAANSDERSVVETLIDALAGSNKALIQTSGTSIVADVADGEFEGKVHEETTPFEPAELRAGRVAINQLVVDSASRGVRGIVIAPSLIYGKGHGVNPNSMQVPWLIDLARKHRVGRHVGPGKNIWSNVHIDDVVSLFVAALDKAPGGALYYAENGENSMQEVSAAISKALGYGEKTRAMSVADSVTEWGEGAARYTMGSNSRVRGVRAREELNWSASGPALLYEIEQGCYAAELKA